MFYIILEVSANMGLLERKLTRDVKSNADMISRVVVPAEAGNISAAEFISTRNEQAPVFLRKEQARLRRDMPWIIEQYLSYQLQDLFGDGFTSLISAYGGVSTAVSRPLPAPPSIRREFHGFDPLPVCIPKPCARDVQAVAALLRTAQRPVMLVASQAMLFDPSGRSGGVTDPMHLQAAVIKLGIPTFLSGMARGLLGRNHPIFIRQERKTALKEADVVLLVGAVTDFRLDYGRTLSRKSKVIAINRGKEALSMNQGLFWSAHRSIVADPGSFVLQLASALDASNAQRFSEWAGTLKAREVEKEQGNDKKAADPAYGHDDKTGQQLVNPLRLCADLEAVLPDDGILVGDGGDFVATASYIVRPRGPLRWLDPGAFGTLGVGMGFALGAKLCRPNSPVYLLWGDGSVGYTVAEFDTARRHNLPVIAVVGNDAAWSQIERDQVPIFGDNVACPLLYSPYQDVATGYGGAGVEISGPSTNIQDVLRQAQTSAQSGTPMLVNVMIGKTNFREGSISV